SWSGPNGFTSSLDTVSLGVATTVMSGNYIYTLNIPGCNPLDDTVEVLVNPEYSIAIDTALCQGNSIVLHSQAINTAGVYPFNLVSSTGCDSLRTYTVSVYSANDTLHLYADLCYDETFLLPDGTTTGTPGTYSYALLTSQGCDSTVIITLNSLPMDSCVFIIPNVFSPNGDGINDAFFIKGLSGAGNSLKIMNRWGDVLYESADYQNNWNGTAKNGKKLSDGVYYYLLTSQKKGEFHGFVHILGK
ncbi:MAG: gliding motility-associated C-terminal domain-containing protein, partial [Flavobacteriales bacterium]